VPKNREAATGPDKVFLVQKAVLSVLSPDLEDLDLEDLEGEFTIEDDQEQGWVPVKAFTDRAKAEEYCRMVEGRERAVKNPFEWGTELKDWTTFDAPRFRDWLLDAGIEPPKKKNSKAADWQAWWEKGAPKLTDLQRAKVWEALNKVRYYEVVELSR